MKHGPFGEDDDLVWQEFHCTCIYLWLMSILCAQQLRKQLLMVLHLLVPIPKSCSN